MIIIVPRQKQEVRTNVLHVELDRYCSYCGHVSAANVVGLGRGQAPTGADAAFDAEDNAQRDAALLVKLAQCPSCKRREASAVGSVLLRASLGAIAGCVLLLAASGMKGSDLFVIQLGLGLGGAALLGAGIYQAARRFSGAFNRVRFISEAPATTASQSEINP